MILKITCHPGRIRGNWPSVRETRPSQPDAGERDQPPAIGAAWVTALKILTAKAAAEKAGVSIRQLYYLVELEKFPRQIQITDRRVGWLDSEIDRWILEKVQARDREYGIA